MSRLSTWLARLGLRRSLGGRGEQLAAAYLRRQGYRILARNLRNNFGEIDILGQAPDGRTIVVVEVKSGATATANNPGARGKGETAIPPEQHVNRAKQRRLVALACQVARRYKLTDHPIRFDVVGVVFHEGQKPQVRHHPGAFEAHV